MRIPIDMTSQGLPVPPIRRSSTVYREPHTQPLRPRRRRPRWLVPVTFFLLVFLGIVWNLIVSPWLTGIANHWNYGASGVSELDANFGQGEITHFLAQYYKGQVLIFEIPPNAPDQMKVYVFTIGSTFGPHPVITLSAKDTRHDGRLDLLIQIEGDPIGYILYNTGTGFSVNGG